MLLYVITYIIYFTILFHFSSWWDPFLLNIHHTDFEQRKVAYVHTNGLNTIRQTWLWWRKHRLVTVCSHISSARLKHVDQAKHLEFCFWNNCQEYHFQRSCPYINKFNMGWVIIMQQDPRSWCFISLTGCPSEIVFSMTSVPKTSCTLPRSCHAIQSLLNIKRTNFLWRLLLNVLHGKEAWNTNLHICSKFSICISINLHAFN
jgi:hypothetical protein